MAGVIAVLALLLPGASRGQWETQSLTIKPGWTAVYLHVDASYTNLDYLVGGDSSNPIAEIWLWQAPPSTLQFVSSPQTPLTGNNQWANWARLGLGMTRALSALAPNAACLVRSTATTNYVWRLKGRPAAPSYTWTTTGLNFLGFPTPAASPPMFDSFLSLAPAFQSAAEIYQYPGGNLGATNPARVFAMHTTPVTRGQAFWMRAGTTFNNYFCPFQVALQNQAGVSFGDSGSQYSLTLANLTASNLTVSLQLLASETPPVSSLPVIAGPPPLLVRGALNTTNLTYGFASLPQGAPQSWVLAPQGQQGSQVAVVLGLNRYSLPNATPGTLYAGILRLTDSFGFSQVDLPVSALAASSAGLWVGNASVSQVRNYLTDAVRNPDGSPMTNADGISYMMTNVNNSMGNVAQPFPLRLILHNNGSSAVLLQRVFCGRDPFSNSVVATSETVLDPTQLGSARRITATHLPWTSTNTRWRLSGQLAPGSTLSATVDLPYDDQASNPFLHTYHPDHDNLDRTFTPPIEQAPGAHSFEVSRLITLGISPPANDFASLTTAGQVFSGTYNETITLKGINGASRGFDVAGVFALSRISTNSTLSTP